MNTPTICWFRQDLRLTDNPALRAAKERGGPVIPLFIWSPSEEAAPWHPGGASRWWLHQSLAALDEQLHHLNSRLIFRHGPTLEVLRELAQEIGADAVLWNRCYEPAAIARDTKVKEALRKDGLIVESFNAALLYEPWEIQNQSHKPFQVFTPFWKHCLKQPNPPEPLPKPQTLYAPPKWPRTLALDNLELEPQIKWTKGIHAAWNPGELGAEKNLKKFLRNSFNHYSEERNRPDLESTSRLSPHLHFGELSPRQIWHSLARMAAKQRLPTDAWRSSQFLAEIGWREFSHHLLYHFPYTPTEPLRANFQMFPWRMNAKWLKAWQRGQTGFPIVDAGMRELWKTGWMHNRVRMIAASFLVKDLLIDWQFGVRWFWDTLVDADLAQNTLGWQWIAGCGADAAPYFRVFNPTTQGEKFDPFGNYIRRWCPELAKLPTKWIHQPHKAPADILLAAGVVLECTYPLPIVKHTIAREVALMAFAHLKSAQTAR